MEKLAITETKDSPTVILDPITNIFSISGVCHPENVTKFYDPIIDWIERYKAEIKETKISKPIQLSIFFKYINSASYKYLLTFLQLVEGFPTLGVPVSVIWYYEPEDVDMKEAGVELFDFSGVKLPYVTRVKED
jgi:3'-phosphoadenosine 5'-phosphosulfate (PAPS) 3'-phosphatase